MAQPNDASLSPALITGGCGFIGSHLVERLLKSGCQVHVIDIDTSKNRFPGVVYHQHDIASASDVDAVFAEAKPKTVFHLACPDSMIKQPTAFQRCNIDGVHNLLNAARKTKSVQAFINTSSSGVVHDGVSDLIDADESFPILEYPRQKKVYTLTKAAADKIITGANRDPKTGGMLTVTLYPTSCFGERDGVMMGPMVASARAGQARYQIGDGRNEFCVMYIGNLVDVEMVAAHRLVEAYGKPAPAQEERVDGEIFFVTNDENTLFWDFSRAMAASVGFPVKKEEIQVVPKWVALLSAGVMEWITWASSFGRKQAAVTREAIHLTTCIKTMKCEKAKRVLGYRPRYTIAEGLERAGRWFVEEEKRAKETEGKKAV